MVGFPFQNGSQGNHRAFHVLNNGGAGIADCATWLGMTTASETQHTQRSCSKHPTTRAACDLTYSSDTKTRHLQHLSADSTQLIDSTACAISCQQGVSLQPHKRRPATAAGLENVLNRFCADVFAQLCESSRFINFET